MADRNVVLKRSCYLSADTDTDMPVGQGLTQTAGPAVSWAGDQQRAQ